jgi:hypothetical protein
MAEAPFGHESSAIATERVLVAGLITAAAVIFAVVTVCLVLWLRFEPTRAAGHGSLAAIPPPPRLQAHPRTDLALLRAEKQAALEAWGWTDGTRQFARIPIERAMAIYATEHRPALSGAGTRERPAGGEQR